MTSETQQSGRKLRRFFLDTPMSGLAPAAEVRLSRDETAHLRKVIRLKEGDRCLVTDGQGYEAEAVILSFVSSGETQVRLDQITHAPAPKRPRVRVFSAMIQKEKIEWLVEKLQELGIDAFIPVETTWTMIKMSSTDAMRLGERWHKTAREAVKQSGALWKIKIENTMSFEKALEHASKDGQIVLFHPGGGALPFAEWTKSLSRDSKINLFFGPEAGFTDEEAQQARKKGVSVELTETLLKADTAAFGVAAAVRFLFP